VQLAQTLRRGGAGAPPYTFYKKIIRWSFAPAP